MKDAGAHLRPALGGGEAQGQGAGPPRREGRGGGGGQRRGGGGHPHGVGRRAAAVVEGAPGGRGAARRTRSRSRLAHPSLAQRRAIAASTSAVRVLNCRMARLPVPSERVAGPTPWATKLVGSGHPAGRPDAIPAGNGPRAARVGVWGSLNVPLAATAGWRCRAPPASGPRRRGRCTRWPARKQRFSLGRGGGGPHPPAHPLGGIGGLTWDDFGVQTKKNRRLALKIEKPPPSGG